MTFVMPLPFLKILKENCQYRGEGNASLVVRLQTVGRESQVLRLIKEDVDLEIPVKSEVVRQQLEYHVAFIADVIQPMLGEDVVHLPFVVALSKEDVEIINQSVTHCRASNRLHKIVKEKETFALVLRDYCSLPNHLSNYSTVGSLISVEIKPKQGFLRSGAFYSNHNYKPPLCHFCIMQYHKVQKRAISKRSSYCPTDLFSGCPSRMVHALKALFHCPQNNFRIFKDSDLVYSAEKKTNVDSILEDFFPLSTNEPNLVSMFIELIIGALLKLTKGHVSSKLKINPFKQRQCINSYTDCIESNCTHELPKGCVLDEILRLQMLDSIDFRELCALYSNTKQAKCCNQQMIGCLGQHQLPTHLGERDQMDSECDMDYASRKIWEYLLAMTMKDCSLMITFKLLDNSHQSTESLENDSIVRDKNGNNYLFSLGIMDLDIKTFDKAEAQYRRKASIMQTYLNLQEAYLLRYRDAMNLS